LLTADDFIREQEYFRQRLRRHNRVLHGWGIVCGLEIDVVADVAAGVATTTVSPGYALSRGGDEIIVAEPVSRLLAADGKSRFVAVRYEERLVEPVPPPPGAPAGAAGEFRAVEETYVLDAFETSPGPPHGPWVVLAVVNADPEGQVTIDTAARQQVKTHR
jgi:hypothetical protein